ncbi:MAG: SDR family oxidoreductase [Acidimicrobiia bacterium]
MEQLRFDDRVAVVTGAGGGLGRAYALLLASRGAQVVINDLGGSVSGEGANVSAAQKVVDEITAFGGVAVADGHSVATADGGEAIVQTALDAFGRLDIVVNNAGILRDKSILNTTPEDFDAVIAVHLRGAFCVSRPAFAVMKKQSYGRIVNTTSPAGLYGNFGQTNYSSAKLGLIGMAKTIAVEGAKYNIKANCISPSAYTRMTEGILDAMADFVTPDRVAPVVAYLCHESNQLSGEVLTTMGGHVTKAWIAETQGWFGDTPTLEDIAANIDQICDETNPRHLTNIGQTAELLVKFRNLG